MWVTKITKSFRNRHQHHEQVTRIPTVKLKIPKNFFFKIRIPNFCYIQVIVFDLSYLPVAAGGTGSFSHFFMVAYLLSPNRCQWQIAKVKNYNLNVTEVRDSDLKMLFPGIFNFTVGILVSFNSFDHKKELLIIRINSGQG